MSQLLGLKMVRTIRENQRFATYEVQYNGERGFLKRQTTPLVNAALAREVAGLQRFGELAEAGVLPFEVPRLLAIGDNFIITTWAEGRVVTSAGSRDEDWERLVEIFIAIDRATRLRHYVPSKFSDTGFTDKLWQQLAATSYADHVDAELVERGFELLEENVHALEARLTHADLHPDNLLRNYQAYTVVDYESVSARWPRLYDLVNCTFNRYILDEAPASTMVRLVSEFFEYTKSSETDARLQLNVIAMARVFSLLVELTSEPNEWHNTKATMTAEIAERLSDSMHRILQGQPCMVT